ncbi:MAG: biopolymer transporter ExbD [Opitutaceae bacterium]
MNETLFDVSAPKKARIEIIPLIDVIFFLLATFVLFTLSLDKIKSLEVTFPQAGKQTEDETTVFVHVSEPGVLSWQRGTKGIPELIPVANLPAQLAAYKSQVAIPRVLIRGDTKAKFGAAVAVLDEVRQAGISQVSIQTLASAAPRE